MSINYFQLAVLVGLLLLIALPIVFVTRAAKRRKKMIESGALVLQEKTNSLAIVGLILVFFGAVPGIVVAHIGLAQIKESNERGWGLATAALWIGYAALGFVVLISAAALFVAL